MTLIIENLKKYYFYYIVGILFCGIIFYLAYIYPLLYDDISLVAYTYPYLGRGPFNSEEMLDITRNYYYFDGRGGRGVIYFFIHFKILASILSVLCVSVLFILIPTFVSYNNQSDKKYNFLKNGIISFGIMSLFTLFFSWQFYIINDFFIKIMLLTYVFPMVTAWLFVIVTWYSIMNKQIIIIKNWCLLCFVILFSFSIGVFSSIHSELFSIYMVGMIIGVYILAFIRYKKIDKIPVFLMSLYSGIISGTMIVLTSPGILGALFNPDSFRKPTTITNSLLMLNSELSFISVVCVGIICILGIILYILFRKNNIKLADRSELIWKSIYLFSVYLGFILILFVTRVPYLRALVVAGTIVPLVYLIILLVVSICELLPKSINHLILSGSSIIVTYLMLVTIHNSYLVKNIDSDFIARIDNFQKFQNINNDKFIIPVYIAPFKHIVNRNYQKTGDMGHAFYGSIEDFQLLGGRLFYHLIHPQASNLINKPYFTQTIRNRIDTNNQSVTNHIISPIKFLN